MKINKPPQEERPLTDLGTARVFSAPSESDSMVTHYVLVYPDQRGIRCSCRGWKTHRNCWHSRAAAGLTHTADKGYKANSRESVDVPDPSGVLNPSPQGYREGGAIYEGSNGPGGVWELEAKTGAEIIALAGPEGLLVTNAVRPELNGIYTRARCTCEQMGNGVVQGNDGLLLDKECPTHGE